MVRSTTRDYRAIKGTKKCPSCSNDIPKTRRRCDDCLEQAEQDRAARHNAKRRVEKHATGS